MCSGGSAAPEELCLKVGFLFRIIEEPIAEDIDDFEAWRFVPDAKVMLDIDMVTMEVVNLKSECPILRSAFAGTNSFGQYLCSTTNRDLAVAYTKSANLAYRNPRQHFEFAGTLNCGSRLGRMMARTSITMQMPTNQDILQDCTAQATVNLFDFQPVVLAVGSDKPMKGKGKGKWVTRLATHPNKGYGATHSDNLSSQTTFSHIGDPMTHTPNLKK